MRVVVPYDAVAPKSRLEPVLDADERAAFAAAMLRDVLDAVREAGREPEVLANAPLDGSAVGAEGGGSAEDAVGTEGGVGTDHAPTDVRAPVTVDERSLTPAVDAVLESTDGPVAVVMADLALATPAALERFFAADGDVVLAPGRGGGTNALLARQPGFRADYHGASYLDHLAAAREVGAGVAEVDSFRLATDVDEPADLADLLVHGDGRATAWLRDAGVSLSVDEAGRVGVVREG